MKSAVTSALLICGLPVLAGTPESPSAPQAAVTYSEPSEWDVRLSLYGWAQGLEGDMAVRGTQFPVDIPFSDIWDDLDISLMGSLAASYGRWGFTADMMYSSLSDSAIAPNILGRPTTVNVGFEQFLGNFALSYRLSESESHAFGIYAGARVNHIEAELSGPFAGISDDITWVDPIVGLRFQYEFSPSFYFRALGDYGGFGVSSDYTWQAMAGFGYRITQGSSVFLAYRGIGTDYEDGGFAYDVEATGPLIGLEFTF